MTTLLEYQEIMAAVVLSGDREPAVPFFQGSEGRRTLGLKVYANNLMHALVSALRDTFPTVCRVLGETKFTSVAMTYARRHPPTRNELLIWYGARFPAFLDSLDVSNAPYLPDLARLEYAWLEAYHAREAPPLAVSRFAMLAPDQLVTARLRFHPTVRLLSSSCDINAIWESHRNGPGAPDAAAPPDRGTCLAILRPMAEVVVRSVSPPVFDCLVGLRDGAAFGPATSRLDQNEHLAELQALIAAGLFADIEIEL